MQASDIRKVAVVGAGLMGHGIALELAANGYEVHLHDLTEEVLDRAVENIHEGLDRMVEYGMLTEKDADDAPDRLWIGTDLEGMVGNVDLVIEAAVEDVDVKRKVFAELGRLAPAHAILASNTSSFKPSLYATESGRPDKVIVAHYANPAFLVPLVEIVPGPETSDETMGVTVNFMESLGKKALVAKKEVPGFILNRLQTALLREAMWLVDNDVADPEDIDTALKYGTGRRWAFAGVFEVFELAGWDVVERIFKEVGPSLAASGEVPDALKARVERGDFGAKTGRGFYESNEEWVEETRSRIAYGMAGTERLWSEWAGRERQTD
jgi:3-hydroxybutyryl-CoA dehydrogenase